MKAAGLKRIGKPLMFAIGDNLFTTTGSVAMIGWLQLHHYAPFANWVLTNIPYYLALWVREALNERQRRLERRHIGFA